MFESYKIRKLITQIISRQGDDNSSFIRTLRTFGPDGLEALIEAFVGNKILFADMEKYLNTFYDRKYLELFIELLGNPKEPIRNTAREIIFNRGGVTVLQVLIDNLKKATSQQRRGLAQLISRLGSPAIMDKIVPMIHESEREVVKVGLNILAEIGGPIAASHMLGLVKSDDWWVRKRVVEALSKIKDPASVDPLLEQLAIEKDPKIKITLIQTLGEIGNAKAAHKILPHLIDDDMIVRQMVVEAMEKTADANIVPNLIELMKEADVNVRRSGAEILDKIKDPSTAEMLIKCLKDNDWWVREIATDALSDLSGMDINQKVLKLCSSPDENVRRAAVEFFNRIKYPPAFDALVERLKDSDWWVREKAIQALGKMSDERALDPILELMGDADVRWAVPTALAQIGGDRATVYLGEMLGDPERSLRLSALKGLGKLRSKESLPLIKASVMDSDPEIRDIALEIIKKITGHAVKANQIIAEQERDKWTGGSTVFSVAVPSNTKILSEAILVLDLANSTEIGAKFGDEFAFKLTNRLIEETKPLATRHMVRFTKSTGDGYLMTFSGVKNALLFAQDILKAVSKTNKEVPPEEKIDLRLAVNLGETRVDNKGDRLGTAVNMTFRIEGLKGKDIIPDEGGMKPEELPLVNRILITEQVNQEAEKLKEFTSRKVGFFDLKGISGRHRIFQLMVN